MYTCKKCGLPKEDHEFQVNLKTGKLNTYECRQCTRERKAEEFNLLSTEELTIWDCIRQKVTRKSPMFMNLMDKRKRDYKSFHAPFDRWVGCLPSALTLSCETQANELGRTLKEHHNHRIDINEQIELDHIISPKSVDMWSPSGVSAVCHFSNFRMISTKENRAKSSFSEEELLLLTQEDLKRVREARRELKTKKYLSHYGFLSGAVLSLMIHIYATASTIDLATTIENTPVKIQQTKVQVAPIWQNDTQYFIADGEEKVAVVYHKNKFYNFNFQYKCIKEIDHLEFRGRTVTAMEDLPKLPVYDANIFTVNIDGVMYRFVYKEKENP